MTKDAIKGRAKYVLISPWARMLAGFEATIGVLYVAILIALGQSVRCSTKELILR